MPAVSGQGHDLIGVDGDRFVRVSLATGELTGEAALPKEPSEERKVGACDGPFDLRGGNEPRDFIFRWSEGPGEVFALDEDFNLLWEVEVGGIGLGHTHAVIPHDIDGDGRDEVFATSIMLDAEGQVLWSLDRAKEIAAWPGGGHVDNVAVGDLSGDAELDPVVFMLAGSAGVYVVDGTSGETRAAHRIGHAQGIKVARFRAEGAGLQALIRTRWGNHGILTLFSGRGERLLRMQPDPVGRNSFVNWRGDGEELIGIGFTHRGMGLYDGYGRKVVEFPPEFLKEDELLLGNSIGWADLLGDVRDEIIVTKGGVLHIYTQDRPPADSSRIYAPLRKGNVSYPGWECEGGK